MHIIPRDDSPTLAPAPFPIPTATPVAAGAPMLPPMTLEQISETFALWQRAQAGQTGTFPPARDQSKEPEIKKQHGEKRPLSDAEVRSSKKLKIDENGVIDITSDGEDEVEDDIEYEDEEDAVIDAPEVNRRLGKNSRAGMSNESAKAALDKMKKNGTLDLLDTEIKELQFLRCIKIVLSQ